MTKASENFRESYRELPPCWVGNVPKGWRTDWMKWVVQAVTKHPSNEEKGELPYISNEDIESWTGRLLVQQPMPTDAGCRKFRKNDVLLNKLRPYLAKVFHATFDGVSSSELLCLRPSKAVDSRFLFYVLVSKGFIDSINADTFGAKMPRADWEIVGHQSLPLPPLSTQQQISRFLDEKTVRIDELIEKKRALLDRLAEKRQALITGAVTKGLEPNAPMKPSGIDWIGNIPVHWKVKKLGYISQILHGLAYSLGDVVDEGNGIFVIRASNVQDGKLVKGDNVFVNIDVSDRIINRVGDIVVCSCNGSRNLIGKNAIVTEEWEGCTFGAFMTTIRTELSSWVRWVLGSTIFEFYSGLYASSTINQLKSSTLKSLPIPIPPKRDIDEISSELHRICRSLDSQHELVMQSVEKLAEYRAALITNAVTGQIGELNGNEIS